MKGFMLSELLLLQEIFLQKYYLYCIQIKNTWRNERRKNLILNYVILIPKRQEKECFHFLIPASSGSQFNSVLTSGTKLIKSDIPPTALCFHVLFRITLELF